MTRRRAKRRRSENDGLSFITDRILREDIKTALEFFVYLTGESAKTKSRRKRKELYRTAILYVASATEALCLFLLARSGVKREKVDCKYQSEITLPPDVVVPRGKLVVALQERTPIPLEEMPFAQVIGTLAHEKLIPKQLAASLDALREARNTQHLYARRSHTVSEKMVSRAFATFRDMLNVIASHKF